MSESTSPSRLGEAVFQRYICIRGREPSPGVAKFALLVPPPSCASAFTGSLPNPPSPKLFAWKLPAASVKPCRRSLSCNDVVQIEQVGHRRHLIRDVSRSDGGVEGEFKRLRCRDRLPIDIHAVVVVAIEVGIHVVAARPIRRHPATRGVRAACARATDDRLGPLSGAFG